MYRITKTAEPTKVYINWTGICIDVIINFQNYFEQTTTKEQIPWPESSSELYRPSNCRFSAKLVPTFADTGCHVVSVTDPYGRNLGFLHRSRYFFFQEAPRLYSRGWADPVLDPILLRKSDSAGNWTRTSESICRNSDHYTTEAVNYFDQLN
jgi:hypothetical protein